MDPAHFLTPPCLHPGNLGAQLGLSGGDVVLENLELRRDVVQVRRMGEGMGSAAGSVIGEEHGPGVREPPR